MNPLEKSKDKKKPKKTFRLEGLEVEEISLVTKPAIGRTFLLMKSMKGKDSSINAPAESGNKSEAIKSVPITTSLIDEIEKYVSFNVAKLKENN